jgi:hypothetical protein
LAAGPMVRIHLAPAASLLQTPIEPGATRVSEGFPDLLAFGFPNLFHEEHRFRLTLFADGQERRDGAGVTRS